MLRKERAPHAAGGGTRQVLVGELCPQALAGRPAVAPLLLRSAGWTDNVAEVTGAVERGATPRFAAFGTDGKLAGVFEAMGLADVTLGQSVAAGTYVGGAPCSAEGEKGQRDDDAACQAATNGCGLAVAELARPDDPPETPKLATGGACLAGAAMGIDIDGDGINEWFPLSGVLDGTRGPAQEWSAGIAVKGACNASFTSYDVALTPETEAGRNVDPKARVTLDVLGVLDLDGDGRKDVVLALRFPTVRVVVVYSATASPQRLELVGEAQAFQK